MNKHREEEIRALIKSVKLVQDPPSFKVLFKNNATLIINYVNDGQHYHSFLYPVIDYNHAGICFSPYHISLLLEFFFEDKFSMRFELNRQTKKIEIRKNYEKDLNEWTKYKEQQEEERARARSICSSPRKYEDVEYNDYEPSWDDVDAPH